MQRTFSHLMLSLTAHKRNLSVGPSANSAGTAARRTITGIATGHIERFHQSLKKEEVASSKYRSLTEAVKTSGGM